jgi:chromosome segregation ATPase
MKSLSLKEEAVASLSRSNETLEQEVQALQDRNHFLNETTTGLEQLVLQVRFQLDESDKQVTYLKRIIHKKVATLKAALDLQRASKAATDMLQAELADIKSRLTAFEGQ